jgi:hypothetical protein
VTGSRFLGLLVAAAVAVAAAAGVNALTSRDRVPAGPVTGCQLAAGIRHVIYLQFDNVHLSRDQPTVPSDLEQMPHLFDFLKQNGTVLAATHTPLIAHTAGDLLTSLTGLYPDQDGQAVSNSWRYFSPDGSLGTGHSFTYWTSRVYGDAPSPTDTALNVVTSDGRNTPAPWVPFTRAGCDVGSVAGPAGLGLQNGADVTDVFGAGSGEAAEASTNPRAAYADYVGLSVHCAAASPLCSTRHGGVPDRLPDEPGGYEGFRALFGQRHLAPGIPVPPFQGFDAMTPSATLADVAAMQEHGVPVTFAYLSDAHDPRDGSRAFGPGEPGYVAQLRQYDQGFAGFLARLASDGIDDRDTLFVVGADEGDVFVGSSPEPAGCDGVHTPCRYARTGEVQVDLRGLLAGEHVSIPAYGIHEDSAPAIWVSGNPDPGSAAVRALGRGIGRLEVTNPYGGAREPLARFLADRSELKLLHMVAGDPARVPDLVLFARPDYYAVDGPATCTPSSCAHVDSQSAYNHGDVDPAINTTWVAFAGPGVARRGVDRSVWADETDTRPTLLALTGLRDSYRHDGRVLSEVLLHSLGHPYEQLAQSLERIDSPVGPLGLASLALATSAIESDTPVDGVYRAYLTRTASLTARRAALAGTILGQLEAAAFSGRPLSAETARTESAQADALVAEVTSTPTT